MSSEISNESLAARIQAGEENLYPQLWEQVRRFAAKQAVRYWNRGVYANGHAQYEVEDLIQSGYIAMVNAVGYFQQDSGFTFLTFFKNCLKTAFADVAGVRKQSSRDDALHFATSLDVPIGEDGDAALVDIVPDPNPCSAEDAAIEALYQTQLRSTLEQAIDRLSDGQAHIIRQVYFEGQTDTEIAEHLGCTASNVQQSRKAALDRLYRTRRVNGLQEYLDAQTSFFAKKSAEAFRRTHSSIVEDIVIRRDALAKKWLRDNFPGRKL